MPLGQDRERILYRLLSRVRGIHRYTLWRWAVGVVFTIGIALLPITRTLRFDLWRGEHYWLGERVDIVGTAKAFVFPFLFVNIAIILVTRWIGRYLCGFVCPVGSLARLSEWSRYEKGGRFRRLVGAPAILALCILMGAITFSFWVDWRVFVDGSPLAKSLSGGFLAAMILGLYGLTHHVGLRFCRDWCPSGCTSPCSVTEASTGSSTRPTLARTAASAISCVRWTSTRARCPAALTAAVPASMATA